MAGHAGEKGVEAAGQRRPRDGIVGERVSEVALPAGFSEIERRDYGETKVVFGRFGEASGAP